MAGSNRRLEALTEVLARWLGRLDRPAAGGATALRVFQRWAETVGEPIAAHARPVALRGDVLWLEVDHATWQSEMVYLGPQLVAAVNRRLGRPLVRQVRVRAAGAGGRPGPAPAPAAAAVTAPRAAAEDYHAARAHSGAIADDEVRAAFEGMLAQLARRQRHRADPEP